MCSGNGRLETGPNSTAYHVELNELQNENRKLIINHCDHCARFRKKIWDLSVFEMEVNEAPWLHKIKPRWQERGRLGKESWLNQVDPIYF